jgi:hypothetical protein
MSMSKGLSLVAIKRLVAAGESDTLELKRTTGDLREGMQTLCGFLNHRGGAVVFGSSAIRSKPPPRGAPARVGSARLKRSSCPAMWV